jgi:hypothetical protein
VAVPTVYLDEMVASALAEFLRLRGFSVTTVREEGMQGADDASQLRFAAERDWLILTYDYHDFRRLHVTFQQWQQPHGGILLIPGPDRLQRLAIRAAMLLDWVGTLAERHSRLITWGDLQYQLTQGLRPSGYAEADVRLALGQSTK